MENYDNKKIFYQEYFRSRNIDLSAEIKLLVDGGKLKTEDGWGNVFEHCLIQAIAADVISDLLNLGEEEKQKLMKAAAVHDWNKRSEKKQGDFTEEERQKAESLLTEVNPDKTLLAATGLDFLAKISKPESGVSFLEKLQFYLDDITRNTEIVSFDDRINEVESRRQDLNENDDYTKLFGMKFFDKEREVGHSIEQEIYDKLKQNGVEIDIPSDIPHLIRKNIEDRINK
jgi:hypothetical protein